MAKDEGVLDDYNEILFGKLNRSYVTAGEYHKSKKHKCKEEH